MRYGPGDDDVKPMGCTGDKCPITIVEYFNSNVHSAQELSQM